MAIPHTILIYRQMALGGIETFMVRWANHLSRLGRKVTVCVEGGPLIDLFEPGVELILYANGADLVRKCNPLFARSAGPFLLVSFDAVAAARAMMLEAMFAKKRELAHLAGVFHPRAYFYDGERRDRKALDALLARVIGFENFFFMNEESRRPHSDFWRRDLSASLLVAIPIDESPASWIDGGRTALRIVSVGRLVGFKAYNLGAPTIVRDSLERGLALSWDIYGTGELEPAVAAKARSLGVTDQVRLMGELPYPELQATLGRYHVFIGMGTAALEAGMAGLPTILACDREERLSYGYISDAPPGSLGEQGVEPPTQDIGDLLLDYWQSGPGRRQSISQSSRAVALSQTMPPFIAAIDARFTMVVERRGWLKKRLMAGLYRLVTESGAIRLARRLVGRRVA